MVNKTTSSKSLLGQIQQAHHRALKSTHDAVRSVIECGTLLGRLRDALKGADFLDQVETVGIKRTTAWKYMRVAERWSASARQLENGITLCDLYREFGILPPLEGGGRRLGKAELERRKAVEQMTFHFEQFEFGLREVARFTANNNDNPFRSVERPKLAGLRDQVKATLDLIEESLEGEVEV